MKLLGSILAVFLAASFATSAFLPESQERKDNVIVLEAMARESEGDRRDGPSSNDQESDSFELVIPVARNFSSLQELFQILKEDNFKEPRGTNKPAPTYVKGTERNVSDFLFFFFDSDGKGKGST